VILALETASEVGGVALLDGDRSLGERVLSDRGRHAAELMPAVRDLLAAADRHLDDVEFVALSIGPGSFTGLRIGLSTALGLCFGSGRRILPVPTLAALSLEAGDRPAIVPMLDARRGQVYAGLYAQGGRSLRADEVTSPLPWLESLGEHAEVWLLGPGARLYHNEIESVLGARAHLLGAEQGEPRAANVARLGREIAEQGGALAPSEVEPRYLRPPEAVEKRAALLAQRKPII